MSRLEYDPRDPALVANPYPLYDHLRAQDPVHWSQAMRAWVVTRYEDVLFVLKDPRFSAEDRPPLRRQGGGTTMITADAYEHVRLRRPVRHRFTAAAVEALRARVIDIVRLLISERVGASYLDVVAHLAEPLPVMIIGELLGAPPEDRLRIKRWSDDVAPGVVGRFSSAKERRRGEQSGKEIRSYLQGIIAEREQDLQDDLVSDLVVARQRGQLTEAELLDTSLLLLAAGNETTTGLIGNGALALLRHPDQWRSLRETPSLAASAVEELLRYDSPVQAVTRRVRERLILHARTFEEGQVVVAVLAAANRDPERFDHPHELDIRRQENAHLAFGAGTHLCLGAPLARLEAQIALATLVGSVAEPQLLEEPVWTGNFVMRRLKRLPIAC